MSGRLGGSVSLPWRRLALAIGIVLGVADAAAQTIRFSPGENPPIALNPLTNVYEEGESFDPLVCAEQPCIELLHNIFEPLVATSENRAIEPRLATGWQRRDEVTYRFELRQGVQFHNGEAFDAEAVRFTLERASSAYGGTAWFPRIAELAVVDRYTIDVALQRPDSLFLHRLANIGLIIPPLRFRQAGAREFGRHPVGTGAFKFVRWDAERHEVLLSRNEDYWRSGYPKVERLVYAYMNGDDALQKLIAGELDVIRRLNPRKTTQFMRLGGGQIVKAWLPQFVLGSFNLMKPETPLGNRKVRQAINLAVNRDHLIRYGAIGNGRLFGGYTVPEDPDSANLAAYPFNPSEARRLLADAGYGDGFDLSIMVARQVPPQIEKIISVSLRRIGISVRVRRVAESEYLEELYLPKFGGGSTPSFDILLLSVPAGSMLHAAMVPMTLLYSREPNESSIRDRLLDDLYETGLRSYDPDRARAVWQRLEQYTTAQNLLFIGYQERAVFGANTRLRFTPRTLMSFWDASYEPDADGADAGRASRVERQAR